MIRTLPCIAALAACGGSFGEPPGDPDGGDRQDDSGATGLIDYEPSNVPANHLTVGTAHIVFSSDVTINTETGLVSVGDPLPGDSIFVIVPQQGGPDLGVFSWASVAIDDGVTVSVEGANGLVIAIRENATIAGVIDASAGRVPGLAGPGGGAGGNDALAAGAGLGGGGTRGDRDAGGGGGGHGAAGGDGGRQEGNPGGLGGLIAGAETNVPLLGGSGGGRGGDNTDGGDGGGGGGALQISVRGEIRLASGGINVSGAGGIGGTADKGGGGGGAGGAILLEGRQVVLGGVLAANGGGGGAGANQNTKGSDGENGAFAETPAQGGTASGEGTAGGAGAAGGAMIGLAGSAGNGNTGGGGGGGGRIFVRTRDSSPIAGLVSPQASVATGNL